MRKFEVSVIIPVYNVEEFIGKAVESASAQRQVSEILLIEDGSTDNCFSICLELSKKYKQVRLLQHPDKGNHGASASRNLGIRNAKFPYVSFLDADDYYLPNRFKKTCEIFDGEQDVDGVYEAVGIFYQNEDARYLYKKIGMREITTIYKKIAPENLFVAFMKGGIGHFHLNGFTAKKEVFSLVGFFNEKFDIGEDSLLSFQLSAKCKLVAGNTQNPVAVRRVHQKNRITYHAADKRKAYYSMVDLWAYFLKWGKINLPKQQYKWVVRRYINQVRTIDQLDDYRLADFIFSRSKMITMIFESTIIFFEISLWRKLFPRKEIISKLIR